MLLFTLQITAAQRSGARNVEVGPGGPNIGGGQALSLKKFHCWWKNMVRDMQIWWEKSCIPKDLLFIGDQVLN